ncbi:MAG TPA: hypothetical protein VIT68_00695 [Candidatus Gracilibacteria bacterium]
MKKLILLVLVFMLAGCSQTPGEKSVQAPEPVKKEIIPQGEIEKVSPQVDMESEAKSMVEPADLVEIDTESGTTNLNIPLTNYQKEQIKEKLKEPLLPPKEVDNIPSKRKEYQESGEACEGYVPTCPDGHQAFQDEIGCGCWN